MMTDTGVGAKPAPLTYFLALGRPCNQLACDWLKGYLCARIYGCCRACESKGECRCGETKGKEG